MALWPWIRDLLQRVGAPPLRKTISVATARRIGAVLESAYRAFKLPGEPRMTRFLASQLGTHHYYDISAARRDLGYEPRVSMAEGLERLVAWLRAHGS